ncbi:hypothetical protein Sango_1163700 [Sesamum angolense]|uniref:Reverse transcriptase zinc-binding domain-containing protein n=1 Tax=Sesamum angolense TaxID=2727404 RepID=A0AAE1WW93_9LAMI|nr:hypothetical protein Sango_1163700 [Sesamum angolense]
MAAMRLLGSMRFKEVLCAQRLWHVTQLMFLAQIPLFVIGISFRGARVPLEVYLFAWKVCKNALPIVCNLRKRGVEVKDGCVLCDAEEETLLHALVLCLFARLVWALSTLPWLVISRYESGLEGWTQGMRELDCEDFAIFLVICWSLWNNRNKWIFEGRRFQAHELLVLCFGLHFG